MERRIPFRPGSDISLEDARIINAPAYHEGVGNALRSAFEIGCGLPDDIAELLRKVDR